MYVIVLYAKSLSTEIQSYYIYYQHLEVLLERVVSNGPLNIKMYWSTCK